MVPVDSNSAVLVGCQFLLSSTMPLLSRLLELHSLNPVLLRGMTSLMFGGRLSCGN